jgi:hypothetical protein
MVDNRCLKFSKVTRQNYDFIQCHRRTDQQLQEAGSYGILTQQATNSNYENLQKHLQNSTLRLKSVVIMHQATALIMHQAIETMRFSLFR